MIVIIVIIKNIVYWLIDFFPCVEILLSCFVIQYPLFTSLETVISSSFF